MPNDPITAPSNISFITDLLSMDWSALIRTKTFWLGVIGVGFGVYEIVSGNPGAGWQDIQLGLTGIFVRNALART